MQEGSFYPGETYIAPRQYSEEELEKLTKKANENVQIYLTRAEINARNEKIAAENQQIIKDNETKKRGRKSSLKEFIPIDSTNVPGQWLISESAYIIAKREAMGVPLTAKSLTGDKKDAAIKGFRYLVEVIMGLTVEEYDALYSSAFNSKHLATAIRTITNKASRADMMECAGIKKNLLFKMVWPDYYRTHYPKITSMDIFRPKGELKASLIHQCQITNKNSGPIDQMAAHAIRDMLPSIGYITREEQLKFMANIKKNKFHNTGIFKIINDNCKYYACMLDFFYLNLSRDEQVKYIDVYYKERQKLKDVKPNKILDVMYGFYKVAEKKRAIARGENVSEKDVLDTFKEAQEKLTKTFNDTNKEKAVVERI